MPTFIINARIYNQRALKITHATEGANEIAE